MLRLDIAVHALRARSCRSAARATAHAVQSIEHTSKRSTCASQLALHRGISTTRTSMMAKKATGDGSEALLAQQMLDFMNLSEEDSVVNEVSAKIPVNGVIMDVKNHIASISGLRNATVGSVVTIHADADASESQETLCRGVVLFLEKKVAQVALLNAVDSLHPVRVGMTAHLDSGVLEIPVSIAKFAGKAVDPLGNVIPLVYANEDCSVEDMGAHERISVAWGSSTVPGLMQRGQLKTPLRTGITAIDCLHPLALGHRCAILGPRNTGKTRMTLDMIARQVAQAREAGQTPPHFVYVCIGKTPTRVQQILQLLEQTEALEHTTIVSASDRDSRILQYLAPFTGCAVAEYFMANKGHCVVVYDDLSTHTMVVESLVDTMKLPKAARLTLSGHTVLLERAAQFVRPERSLTAFVLADAPDAASGETSEFKERIVSVVDDSITLEAPLALQRAYPPIDVLQPGASVRGPPFQSALMWRLLHALRSKINASCLTNANVEMTRQLGLEVEPEDAEVLEFRELVRQFFSQTPLLPVSQTMVELGVLFLVTIPTCRLPPQLKLWEFIRRAHDKLIADEPELLRAIESAPKTQRWPHATEEHLERVLLELADVACREYRMEQASQEAGDALRRAILYRKRK